MFFIIIAGIIIFLGLLLFPMYWVNHTIKKYNTPRADYPGTGAELARHLLDEAQLHDVGVEKTGPERDHYAMTDRVVRLSPDNYDGRSLSAVAIAAHEVGHALQHAEKYRPLFYRQSMTTLAAKLEIGGQVLLVFAPLLFIFVHSPVILLVEVLAGVLIISAGIIIHIFTLPTELDASFKKALPLLSHYLPAEDLPAARKVLQAAAFTYVAGALLSLLNVARWFRLLRF